MLIDFSRIDFCERYVGYSFKLILWYPNPDFDSNVHCWSECECVGYDGYPMFYAFLKDGNHITNSEWYKLSIV